MVVLRPRWAGGGRMVGRAFHAPPLLWQKSDILSALAPDLPPWGHRSTPVPPRAFLSAHCWVAFLYRQLAPAVEGTKCHRDRMNILTLVRKSCPTLVASDRPSPRPKRQRMDCENICEPAIAACVVVGSTEKNARRIRFSLSVERVGRYCRRGKAVIYYM